MVLGRLVGAGLVLLGLEPVGELGGLGGSGGVLALDLNGHVLVLLEAAGEVGLLGGLGGLGGGKGLDLALGVGLLDGGSLVGLELLEVELLDEVGWERNMLAWRHKEVAKAATKTAEMQGGVEMCRRRQRFLG